MLNSELKRVLILFLGIKLTLFLLLFLAASLLPYSKEMYERNFLYPANEKHSVVSAFKAWDGQHYVFLAEKGYQPEQESNRFSPLYPSTIWVVKQLVGNTIVAGLLVSTVFSFLAVYFLFSLTKLLFNKTVAFYTSLIFILFPTGFYLSLIYSEALFLFLVLAFFYYLFKRQYFLAGLFSLFIPLSRPVGMYILIPFILFFLLDRLKQKKVLLLPSFDRPVKITIFPQVVSLLFPFLGLGIYFMIMAHFTGGFLSGVTSLSSIGSWQITNILSPDIFLKTLFSSNLTLHGFQTSIIDRLFFLSFVVSLPFLYKKLDKTLFIYALLLGSVPLFGSFMAYTRYLLPVFPLFIVLALLFSNKRLSFLLSPFLAFTFALQVFFCILYGLNYWIA